MRLPDGSRRDSLINFRQFRELPAAFAATAATAAVAATTAAVSTAAATAAVSATTTTTASTCFARLSFVNGQRTAIDLFTVKARDRFLAFCL